MPVDADTKTFWLLCLYVARLFIHMSSFVPRIYVPFERESCFMQICGEEDHITRIIHLRILNLNLNDYVEVPRSLVLYDVGGLC